MKKETAMTQGEVVSIHVAPAASEAMETLGEARAIAGRGIEGDRYAGGAGTFSVPGDPGKHVTLIAAEAIEAVAREFDIHLPPECSRRNIVTRGVDLSALVGKTFRVGEALLRGVRANQPCMHFENLLGIEGLKAVLEDRSGLNAEVVASGRIRPGDPIRPAPED